MLTERPRIPGLTPTVSRARIRRRPRRHMGSQERIRRRPRSHMEFIRRRGSRLGRQESMRRRSSTRNMRSSGRRDSAIAGLIWPCTVALSL